MNQGIVTLNFIDRVEIYGLFGTIKMDLLQRPLPNVQLEYQTNNHFVWGVGGRAILLYWGEVVLGIDAKYLASPLKIDQIFQNSIPRSASGADFHYSEWQIGLGLAYELEFLVPYVGLTYSYVSAELNHISEDDKFVFTPLKEPITNRDRMTFVVGCSLDNVSAFYAQCRSSDDRRISPNPFWRY